MRRSFARLCAAAASSGSAAPPSGSNGKQSPSTSTTSSSSTATSPSSPPASSDSASTTTPPPPKPARRFKVQSGYINETQTAQGHEERGRFFSSFMSIGVISLGCSFLFVPLYRMYCAPTGRGADPKFYTREGQAEREERDKTYPVTKKLVKMRFLSDVGNTMPIAFVPLQKEIEMLVGEPALAFFSAYNRSKRTLLGVSSYSIAPPEATNYLNKIQCFCFEEQRFKPHELVEMPVFFYIDKDFLNDPMVNWLDEMILNYTFFNLERTKEAIFRA